MQPSIPCDQHPARPRCGERRSRRPALVAPFVSPDLLGCGTWMISDKTAGEPHGVSQHRSIHVGEEGREVGLPGPALPLRVVSPDFGRGLDLGATKTAKQVDLTAEYRDGGLVPVHRGVR